MKEFRLMEVPRKYVTLSSPLKIFLDITANCNLSCKFCYKIRDQINVNTNIIIKIIEEISNANVLEIVMAGGEPFTLNNPFYIFKKAKEYGLRTGFISNGTLITKDIAEKIPLYIDGCTISFHGPNPKIFEGLTGVTGSFINALNGLKNLNAVGLRPGILYTPTKTNQNQLFKTVEFLIDSGIIFSCIQVNRLIPAGRACQNWSELNIGLDGYKELLKQMFKIKMKWPYLRVETGDAAPFCMFEKKYHNFIVRCNYGITIGGIDEHGNFMRCPCRASKLGNILVKPLKQIWLESDLLISYRNLTAILNECKECSLLEICGGGCLCSNQNENSCIDSYIETNNIKLGEPNSVYKHIKCNKVPIIPKMNIKYTVRNEKERLLCVPLGVQEVYHDTVVPQDNEFPLLWIEDIEYEILRLVDGKRDIDKISEEISIKTGTESATSREAVEKIMTSFIEYNYIKEE